MTQDIQGPPGGPSPSESQDVAVRPAAERVEDDRPPAAAGPAAAGATVTAVATADDGSQPAPRPGRHRKLLYVTLPGCWGALIAGCLSFTPSLLPRGGIIQGVVFGITAAIGYGLGVWAASIWRAFAGRDPRRPRRWAWRTFVIAAR